ncbi:hypothetical protein VTJ04DRAFT_8900 [Mycothermus thermophilus]|uniref:uncharacterized protein n=1 Tax=Humicola insolens TaxID=85995 RepID=UPI0037442631
MMAWDSKPTRRRQSSAASGTRSIAAHARQQSRRVIQPRSQHVADPFLQDFLSPSFDAAAYLNATLPPLQTPTSSSSSRLSTTSKQPAVPLSDLSTQAQALVTQLNAHTTRLTNTLTDLTNDILRSGGRLAYEVELLRGETITLAETLSDRLEDDISKFVPNGVRDTLLDPRTTTITDGHGGSSSSSGHHQRRASILGPAPPPVTTTTTTDQQPQQPQPQPTEPPQPPEPSYITQLRTLTLVRARLDEVIRLFGQAMSFSFPPSEVSVTSSFLSVSAPAHPDPNNPNNNDTDPATSSTTTTTTTNQKSLEEKGQETLQSLRDEIAALLQPPPGSSSSNGSASEQAIKGVEDAAKRVAELKDLALIWKGTAEEKGRLKFVDSLARMVEDRHRELVREIQQAEQQQQQLLEQEKEQERRQQRGRGGSVSSGAKAGAAATAAGAGDAADGQQREERGGYGGAAYGLLSQLQKLRGGL